jgi:hypothetical protein
MNSQGIKKIEDELGVKLPPHYITFLIDFDGLKSSEVDLSIFLYNDPETVIEINRLIGFYSNTTLIKYKLIIGENGGGDYYLIDLNNPDDLRVIFFDHEESFENNYDNSKDTWNWEGFEFYQDIAAYRRGLIELFEIE